MKSYTDIEQSKILSKILPPESADMEYLAIKENGVLVGTVPFVKEDSKVEDSAYSHTYDRIACWSIAALLDIYPMVVGRDMDMYCCWQNSKNLHSRHYNNPVDACYEMILKLHELNLL